MSDHKHKGILFDWVGVLVLPVGRASSNDPESIAGNFQRFHPLWEILPRLKEQFALCIVNNGHAVSVRLFEKAFSFSQFMPFVNSEIEGVAKPHPEIYRRACRLTGVLPSEVIYLDDAVPQLPEETNTLGMHYIHWPDPQTGFNKFKQYLEELGVQV